MKTLLPAALVLLALNAPAAEVERVTRGNLAIEGIPDIPQPLVDRMRRYQFARNARLAGGTTDGRTTIPPPFGHAPRLHVVARPLGDRQHLTFFDEPIGG